MLTSSSKLNNCSLSSSFCLSLPFLPFHPLTASAKSPETALVFSFSSVVTLAMIVVAMMAMVGRREQSLPSVVVCRVGEDTILDVASEDAFLGEGDGIFD